MPTKVETPTEVDPRLSTLSLNEDTGEVKLNLPVYKDDEFVSVASLLFVAMANKIVNDPEWVDEMVATATDIATPETEH